MGEGFSWLADALGGVGEILGWDGNKEKPVSGKGKSVLSVLTEKDEIKKDNLGKIKVLSERLAWGMEEKGLELARLHIPGLGRSYVRALLIEGYNDRKCLEELSEEELGKVVPKRLAGRIKERFSGEDCKVEDGERELKVDNRELKTVLEIDQHRPDRIIFEGKEVKVTTRGFSLICLLAQHRGEVVSYEEILKKLWGVRTEATYTRIIQHIYKFRKDILDVIGNSKTIKKN